VNAQKVQSTRRRRRRKAEVVYDITSVAARYRAVAEKLEAIAASAARVRPGVMNDRAGDILAEHLEVLMS